jgi:hypothetical protein
MKAMKNAVLQRMNFENMQLHTFQVLFFIVFKIVEFLSSSSSSSSSSLLLLQGIQLMVRLDPAADLARFSHRPATAAGYSRPLFHCSLTYLLLKSSPDVIKFFFTQYMSFF